MKKILLAVLVLVLFYSSAVAIELVRQKNVATYIFVPMIDADGDIVTSATGLDSEIDTWNDGAAPNGFTNCTNEATEIGTDGVYYLSLSQSEMNADYIYIQIKTSSTGAKTQHILIRTIVGDPLNFATTTSGIEVLLEADGMPKVNVEEWDASAVPTPNVSGYPEVDLVYYEGVDGVDGQIQSEAADALTAYDPPTRTEATTDKNAIITEVDANETIVTEILDTLKTYDATLHPTVDDILDSLKTYDGTIHTIIQEILDTLQIYDGTFQVVVDDILDTLKVYDDAGHFQVHVDDILDSLKTYDGTLHAVIQEILDTLQVYDGTFQVVVDDVLDSLKTYDGTLHAVIQEILDTLQVYDGTLQAKVQNIADTTNAMLDTIQAHAPHGDDWASSGGDVSAIADTVNAILDTIQAHAPHGDNWATAGSGDTSEIKTLFQNNWDDDTDGFLSAELSLGGARTMTVTVKDTSDSVAIAGFEVDIYDSSSGQYMGGGETNTNGVYTRSLDDETYTVHIKKVPYNLASPRYFIITEDMDSTFYASSFDPGEPASADQCIIYINDVRDMGAVEQEGCYLRAYIPEKYRPVTVGEAIRIPRIAAAASDASGYVELVVYRSAGLTAGDETSTVLYDLELLDEDGNQIVRRRNVEIPDAANWEIKWRED